MVTNCPNCGAPITKSKCEYCGTTFVDAIKLEDDIRETRRNILLAEIDMCRQRGIDYPILANLYAFGLV